jgi:hypothetical protein
MKDDFENHINDILARVAPLTTKNAAGELLVRPPFVDAAIAVAIPVPESERGRMISRMLTEPLIYFIRRTWRKSETVYAQLYKEISRRATGLFRANTRGLDWREAEDIIVRGEARIMELVLAKEPTAKSDFLEIAFTQMVEKEAYNLLRTYLRAPLGEHRGELSVKDEDGKEIKRPWEAVVADDSLGPEDLLLHLNDRNERHRLLRRACAAVPNREQLKALIFIFGYDWPLTSADKNKPSIVRHFGVSERTAQRWKEEGMRAMREALAEEIQAHQARKAGAAKGGN